MRISDIITESKEIRTQKRNDGFTIDLYVDGKHVGQYTHAREDDIVRNQAEIFPEYRNKGYGTMLLLAAIKTADDLGLDFEEDTQSLTPAMSRIYDELADSGMIYGGNGSWAISPSGESELEDFLNEDLVWHRDANKVVHIINEDVDDLYNIIDDLNADDVGEERSGQYVLKYEGFSDWCQQDAAERCELPDGDPRKLNAYEDVYDEVLDGWNKEMGSKPIDTGFSGDEDYPVQWAIYKSKKK